MEASAASAPIELRIQIKTWAMLDGNFAILAALRDPAEFMPFAHFAFYVLSIGTQGLRNGHFSGFSVTVKAKR